MILAWLDAALAWKPWLSPPEAARDRGVAAGPGTGRACPRARPPRGGDELRRPRGDPFGNARPDGASCQQAEQLLQVLLEPCGTLTE
jgi:hypothetical protein